MCPFHALHLLRARAVHEPLLLPAREGAAHSVTGLDCNLISSSDITVAPSEVNHGMALWLWKYC